MKQATAITQKSEIQCDDDYSREYPSERYEELLKEYELMHDTSDQMFNGRSVASFVDVIQHVLKENNCKTLLDYGSGKGLLYTKDYDKVQIDNPTSKPLPELWDINEYTLYDPGYPEHNKLPIGKFDSVICTDVLEHVPEEDLGWVTDELIDYAKKVLFLNIACLPALKKFRDGTNVHVSIFRPEEWATFLASRLKNSRNVDLNIILYADHKVDEKLKRRAYKITHFPTIFQLTED
tara:strand:+ start:138 stop:845 length:708 start_codon:yes stop_codon:yes gene_type:complete